MGISSALNAGVMGLNVNSSKLATISDNIANSETKGYKRASIEFNSLVLTERPTAYDAGGVRGATVRNIDDQGALLSTRNATDIAISGRGFLPVTDIADVEREGEGLKAKDERNGSDLPQKLLRTGAFRPDENGIMQTNSGLVLMGVPTDENGDFPAQTTLESLKPVKIDSLRLAAERTNEVDISVNLDARLTSAADSYDVPAKYFDPLGDEQEVFFSFQKTAVDNQWEVEIQDAAGNPNTDIAADRQRYRLTFNNGTSDPGEAGSLKSVEFFDTTLGTPAFADATAETLGSGDSLWDAETGALSLNVGGQDIEFFIGPQNKADRVTQFAATNQILSIEPDGSGASVLTGIEIDNTGTLDAIFDSGFRITLWKIPIGNVQNPDGMRTLDGQSFGLTRESGSVTYYDAGSGPTGTLVSSALEESTTDVAEELTQLIKTQRAYSSNAKIIQTVDEMLQETTNLKR